MAEYRSLVVKSYRPLLDRRGTGLPRYGVLFKPILTATVTVAMHEAPVRAVVNIRKDPFSRVAPI